MWFYICLEAQPTHAVKTNRRMLLFAGCVIIILMFRFVCENENKNKYTKKENCRYGCAQKWKEICYKNLFRFLSMLCGSEDNVRAATRKLGASLFAGQSFSD